MKKYLISLVCGVLLVGGGAYLTVLYELMNAIIENEKGYNGMFQMGSALAVGVNAGMAIVAVLFGLFGLWATFSPPKPGPGTGSVGPK